MATISFTTRITMTPEEYRKVLQTHPSEKLQKSLETLEYKEITDKKELRS